MRQCLLLINVKKIIANLGDDNGQAVVEDEHFFTFAMLVRPRAGRSR